MSALDDVSHAIGITPRQTPADAKWYPTDATDKAPGNGNGRVKRFADDTGGMVMNWSNPECEKPVVYFDDSEIKLTPAAKAERLKRAKEEQERAAKELAEERAAAARLAMEIWKKSEPAAGNPYLVRKQVEPTETLRQIRLNELIKLAGYHPAAKNKKLSGEWVLIVPVKNHKGMTTVEMIDTDGRKPGLCNGLKSGCFWSTSRLPSGDGTGLFIGIGEGVSTMLTYTMAVGNIGIAALSCGNLKAVGLIFRNRYPAARIEIVSDVGNGEQSAIEAARAVDGWLIKPNLADGSTGSDINDQHTENGLQSVKDSIRAAKQIEPTEAPAPETRATTTTTGSEWPEPHPIESKMEPLPYPLDALPESIGLAVEEVIGFVKAPVVLVASAALSALSMAIQPHADIARADKLAGPAGLYLLTIAESGERKSTCDNFFTKAIREYEAAQAEAAKPAIKKHEAEYTAWDAKYKGITDAIRQAAKNGEKTDDKEADLLQLQEEKPEPPRVPKIIYSDATPEGLKYSLAKQWPSGAVVSSEAGVVFGSHGMGKESAMRNLATLNQLWDGTDMPTERRSSESFTVRGARLTMALQTQESTLRAFFKASGELARGTGFLARFLIAWPESTQGQRPFTEAPENWPHLAAFNRRITEILNQDAPITEDGALQPAMTTLAPDAKEAWVCFHDAIESGLATGGELFDIRDVASKIADNAARLACLFQYFEHGGGEVGLDAFESASRVAAWHLNEARRFFGGLALPQELADAARLDSWMIGCCQQEKTGIIPVTKIQQYGPCGLRSKVAIDAAMEELEGLERARLVKDGKRKTIHINPALIGGEI